MNNFLTIQSFKKELIIEKSYMFLEELLPHEKIFYDRLHGLKTYMESLSPAIIIPSIIICSKTKIIIDGHHRYYALKDLNIDKAPITCINYDSKKIITNSQNNIKKSLIIKSALVSNLFPPKTTEHKIKHESMNYPLILLSDLMAVKKAK